MSRSKKTRKSNENAPQSKSRSKKEERVPTGKKQDSGNRSGSRHNESIIQANASGNTQKNNDPRHGSKKPIQLAIKIEKPSPKKEKSPKMSDEDKLLKLEDDPRLNSLLDMLEEGKNLTADDQEWLNKQLTRIEQLMDKLGITDEEEVSTSVKTAVTDDDLFDKFESGADLLKEYQHKD
ncbi:Der GTPase-activating protein YihI [Shewanella surugensis]|uniref:Der GTPase-activating protein YihI n=1 Tax=Shewanella surugensis TaxID=212020 RepID=A0ABT0L9N0_9GAMM|nr:Der GTPase-activating protein YihI [Shewanella surugensis]MCL1124427.1 Der GTPase-activating protein YihI [Shewanella surugensis]